MAVRRNDDACPLGSALDNRRAMHRPQWAKQAILEARGSGERKGRDPRSRPFRAAPFGEQLIKSVRFLKTKYELQRCLEQRAKVVTQGSGFGAIHEISGKRHPRLDGTILAKAAQRIPSGSGPGSSRNAASARRHTFTNVFSRVDAPSGRRHHDESVHGTAEPRVSVVPQLDVVALISRRNPERRRVRPSQGRNIETSKAPSSERGADR